MIMKFLFHVNTHTPQQRVWVFFQGRVSRQVYFLEKREKRELDGAEPGFKARRFHSISFQKSSEHLHSYRPMLGFTYSIHTFQDTKTALPSHQTKPQTQRSSLGFEVRCSNGPSCLVWEEQAAAKSTTRVCSK